MAYFDLIQLLELQADPGLRLRLLGSIRRAWGQLLYRRRAANLASPLLRTLSATYERRNQSRQ